MRNFRFGRHHNRLLILLQVPLTTFRHQFQVYKVTTLPVHVTGQDSHITELRDKPSYDAVSCDGQQYFTLDHDDDTTHPALLFSPTNKSIFITLTQVLPAPVPCFKMTSANFINCALSYSFSITLTPS